MDCIDIGSHREWFADRLLIDRLRRAVLFQHAPCPREVVIRHDAPWEGPFSLYHTLVQDGDRILLYYRGWRLPSEPAVYCVAESRDGIHFERPCLRRLEWQGRRDTNIFLDQEPYTHTFAPFLDTRPGVPSDERFKAFARGKTGQPGQQRSALFAFVSADGIAWRLLSDDPVITDGAFDSQNVGFWSEAEGKYVAYYRVFRPKTDFASGRVGPTTQAQSLRAVLRATSDDFRHWTPGLLMDYRTDGAPAPVEEFYISQTRPYFRAPHIYVALPARFMNKRRALTAAEAESTGVHATQLTSCSDACFMTTRAGTSWYDRTFQEAFVRPAIGPGHWSGRCNYPVDGILQTGPDELSIYVDEHYAQAANQIRRYSLRLDGFASLRADHGGGEALTRPFIFAGRELELNYATSAAGSLRVEIRDADNRPLPGYTLRDAVDLFGNRTAGRAAWKSGTHVGPLAGRPVRMRLVLRDADLFSFRFV